MPTILSNVPEIRNIAFVPWEKAISGKPADVRIVRVGHLLLAKTKSGLACNSLRNYAYMMGDYHFNPGLMKALVRIGVITSAMAQAHLEECQRVSHNIDARHDAREYERMIEKYGSIRKMRNLARVGKNQKEPNHNFEARLWMSRHDGFVELDVWDSDLTPINTNKCSVRDWAREHIACSWGESDVRDMFDIPDEWECYEVIFRGHIYGNWSNNLDGSEWDEEIDVVGDPLTQKLPDEVLGYVKENV